MLEEMRATCSGIKLCEIVLSSVVAEHRLLYLQTYIGVDISNPWKLPSSEKKDMLFNPLSPASTTGKSFTLVRSLSNIITCF